MFCCFVPQRQAVLLNHLQVQLKKARAESLLMESRVREDIGREFSELFSEMQNDYKWDPFRAVLTMIQGGFILTSELKVTRTCLCSAQWASGQRERNPGGASWKEAGDFQESHQQNGCWTQWRGRSRGNTNLHLRSSKSFSYCCLCRFVLCLLIHFWFKHKWDKKKSQTTGG